MVDRYCRPEMKAVWSEENRMYKILDVEIYACEALAELGEIPMEAYLEIKNRAAFDPKRVTEIEEIIRHDVIAFLTAVAEKVGDASKYLHMGMTSSDVLDTVLSAQLRQSAELITIRLFRLRETLSKKALEHKNTLMMGRTHGIHAEPLTFGLKMALWMTEIDRCIQRLNNAKETISVGQISGAVGTFANINPKVEEHVCRRLGLRPVPVSTQIIQRDRHAEFMTTLALIGSTLDKFSTELRNLQRTEILEVEEAFHKGQKGSSAMPHKRNPVNSERISGLARLLRGNALAAMENIALWHERDITHSPVEAVILPDSCKILDYMLYLFNDIIENLSIFPENMRNNIDKTLGLVFSQRLMLELVNKGVLRETAYDWVQRNALEAWGQKVDFQYLILQDRDIMSKLTIAEVDTLFDYEYHIRYIDYIFHKIGL